MGWPVLLMARELDLGGSERQLALLARALVGSEFEPIVGCFRPGGLRGRELEAAGVPMVHFPVRSFVSRGAVSGAWDLKRFIRRRGVRLVHAFDYPMTVFAVPVAATLTRAVAVSSQRAHRSLIPRHYRGLVRMTDRLASAVVVNCEYLRRHLEQDEQVARSRIRLCPNGIDLEQFSGRKTNRPAALRDTGFVIGTVCALRPEKGLTDLVLAFARVRGAHPDLTLAIVGSGPLREQLWKLSQELGIAENCVFAPATADIAAWLDAMDVFVLPSRSEAFSNSLMEALACGRCAAASRAGGNSELIRDGETGLLFETGDVSGLSAVLERAIGSEALRRRLGTAGQRWVRENFALESAAGRMREIYRDLIEQRGAKNGCSEG